MAPALGRLLPTPRGPSTTPQPTSPASCLKRVLKLSSISPSESTCWLEKGEQVRDPPARPPHGQQLRQGWDHPLAACHFTSLSLALLLCKMGV